MYLTSDGNVHLLGPCMDNETVDMVRNSDMDGHEQRSYGHGQTYMDAVDMVRNSDIDGHEHRSYGHGWTWIEKSWTRMDSVAFR